MSLDGRTYFFEICLEDASSRRRPFRFFFASNSIVRQRRVIICNCFGRDGGFFCARVCRVGFGGGATFAV
jgi:hypothetical protein